MASLEGWLGGFRGLNLADRPLDQGVLPHGRHLAATGRIVDAVLSRMLEDITQLPDITADESHRLSELCRMLNSLEGLFVEGPEQVRHNPSFKPFEHPLMHEKIDISGGSIRSFLAQVLVSFRGP